MKDRVVYTSIVGGFDSLMQPQVTDPRYDYICFVRRGERRTAAEGVWQIEEIPVDIEDNQLLSRYPKMHPEDLLAGYSWCVWIDGNITLRSASFYQMVDSIVGAGAEVAICRHPSRDCAYEEAYAVLSAGKAGYREMSGAVDFLSAEGFPRHAGLFENNIILRSLSSARVRELDGLWWECLCRISRRDQLSLVYCARRTGVEIVPLFPAGTNVRDCEWVGYVRHDVNPQRNWLARKWNGLRQVVSKWLLKRKIARI